MTKKMLTTWLLAGTLLTGGLAACGDDEESEDTAPAATEAPAEDGGEDSGDSGESGGSSAVEEYCAEVDALAEELEAVLADPTSGDVAALTTQSQELIAAAIELQTANPDDVEAINECSQRLSTIGS